MICRQIDVHERVVGLLARKPTHGVRATQSATAARLPSARRIKPSRPPTDSAHVSPSRASSTHSIDGVLIVAPVNSASSSLPFLVIRKIFGSGHGGV